MNPVCTLPPCLFNIYFNIILLSTPRSIKFSLPFRFSAHVIISHLSHTCYLHVLTPRPS
jgi:hypothetical protein